MFVSYFKLQVVIVGLHTFSANNHYRHDSRNGCFILSNKHIKLPFQTNERKTIYSNK